ncbi:MAG TPA: hypothetical protein VNO50_06170 [Pyrinomonadaceae bacterium]|nr:hypothetical protein [Pyrinomonadaceae bacterium]
MKRFLIAVALICALSTAADAADIPSTDKPAPQASSSVVRAIVTIISVIAR